MKSALSHFLFPLGFAAALALPASANDLGEGFLCCNMRTDGSWISDANYMEANKTMIPYGTPAKFTGYGRYRVYLEIGNKRQAVGNDYSRDLDMETFARRYLVKEDPRTKIAAASPKIRNAVESARVTKGMTKEQVITSLGYPISSENPQLDAPIWMYWISSFASFTVFFDSEGKVSKVEGEPLALYKVYLE